MFLKHEYIFARELTEKLGIALANISTIHKRFHDADDNYTIRKMGNCLFINTKSKKLPNNIKKGIENNNFTSLETLLPSAHVKREYGVSEDELVKSGIVEGQTILAHRKFYVFNRDFAKSVKQSTTVILNDADVIDCTERGLLKGSQKVSKNKHFAWY